MCCALGETVHLPHLLVQRLGESCGIVFAAAAAAAGCAPLHYAAKGGHLDICKYLLAARVSI
jgi:hypothetical protein